MFPKKLCTGICLLLVFHFEKDRKKRECERRETRTFADMSLLVCVYSHVTFHVFHVTCAVLCGHVTFADMYFAVLCSADVYFAVMFSHVTFERIRRTRLAYARATFFRFPGTKPSPPRANARTFSTRTRAVQAHFNFSLLMYINSTPANFDLAGCSGFLWRLWFTLPRAPLVLLSKHFDALVRPRAMAL